MPHRDNRTWIAFAVLTAACSRGELDRGRLPSGMDAAVAMTRDAQVDSAVVPDATSDASSDAMPDVVALDASATAYCCGGEAVLTDCSRDCVPTGVTFENMWPCPSEGECTERVVFDGTHAAITSTQSSSTQVYFCNGELLLGSDTRALGRYFAETEVLLFRGESFCATDACRALWQVDGCGSLFDGSWSGFSTGCLEEDEFAPRGCAYDLTFEREGWIPPPASGPVCRIWGDDFVYDEPMTCSDNQGTCGSEPFHVHPTLGIEYGQRWYPSSVVPCDRLVGTWVATDCACRSGDLTAACPRTLHVEEDGRASLESVNATDEVLGSVYCDDTDFVFWPNLEPRSPEWYARLARGDIDVATDTLWVTSETRTSVFARALGEGTGDP